MKRYAKLLAYRFQRYGRVGGSGLPVLRAAPQLPEQRAVGGRLSGQQVGASVAVVIAQHELCEGGEGNALYLLVAAADELQLLRLPRPQRKIGRAVTIEIRRDGLGIGNSGGSSGERCRALRLLPVVTVTNQPTAFDQPYPSTDTN